MQVLFIEYRFSACISLDPKIKVCLRILVWKWSDCNYKVIFKGCFSFIKHDGGAETIDNHFNISKVGEKTWNINAI